MEFHLLAWSRDLVGQEFLIMLLWGLIWGQWVPGDVPNKYTLCFVFFRKSNPSCFSLKLSISNSRLRLLYFPPATQGSQLKKETKLSRSYWPSAALISCNEWPWFPKIISAQLKCSRLAYPVLFRKAHSLPQLDKLSVCTELPPNIAPSRPSKMFSIWVPARNAHTQWRQNSVAPAKEKQGCYIRRTGSRARADSLTHMPPIYNALSQTLLTYLEEGKTFWRGLDQCSATSQHALRYAETLWAAQCLKTT